MAASMALPPLCKIEMAAMVDSVCDVAAIPLMPWAGDLPGSSRLRMDGVSLLRQWGLANGYKRVHHDILLPSNTRVSDI